MLLPNHDYLAACEQTVQRLIEPVIRHGFYHVFPTDRDRQSVFDVSSLAQGLEALYIATGNDHYRDLALRIYGITLGTIVGSCARRE